MASQIGPIPTGHAGRILGLGRDQVNKLIDCGLIPVLEVTGGGQRRVDSDAVLALAARSYVRPREPGADADLNVHLAPLQPDPNGAANQRSHAGFHAEAAVQGLTPPQIEDAWVGLWNCKPEPYVGCTLVGDVSGFVVAVAHITGYRLVNRLIRFDIAAAEPAELDRYAGRRITALPGAPFQQL